MAWREEVLEDELGTVRPPGQPALRGESARKDVQREIRPEVDEHTGEGGVLDSLRRDVDVPAPVALGDDAVLQRFDVACQQRVHDRDVVALEEVVGVGLPVARHRPDAAGMELVGLDRVVVALGRETAEPFDEICGGRVHAYEHESPPAPDPDRREPEIRIRQSDVLGPEVASVAQRSVLREDPAVVAADEVGLAAGAVPHDGTGAVRADVVEGT